MKQENKSPFSLYIKESILISLGDFKLLPKYLVSVKERLGVQHVQGSCGGYVCELITF